VPFEQRAFRFGKPSLFVVSRYHPSAIPLLMLSGYIVREQYSGEGCSTERPRTLTGVWGVLFCAAGLPRLRPPCFHSPAARSISMERKVRA